MADSFALSPEQVAFFEKNGYILIPDVLSNEEIQHLRKRILYIFETGDWKKSPYNTERVMANVFDTFPEFIDLTLNEKALGAIRSLTKSTPVLMPETAIHHQFYTGWHKDTTSQEKSGVDFHWKDGAVLLQCGYYLQDNNALGGGLTVMPGSHQTKDYFYSTSIEVNFWKRVKRKLGIYNEAKDKNVNPHNHPIVDIPSKAGDFVIFNMRTNHRATQPANGRPETVPFEHSKIAVFNAFTADNFSAEEYFNYITSRQEPFYQALKNRPENTPLNEAASRLNFKVM